LDNQSSNTEMDVLLKRSALVGIGVLLVALLAIAVVGQLQVSDPYVKTVLSLTGNPVQGHAIFQMNCAGCHTWRKDSQVGPSLEGVSHRKSEVGIVEQVISGKTPPMPQFQPSPQEMADLLSYLKTI
jgi:mono/diheme cytochrome c family protein